jgi:hypothetical protein
VRRELRACTDIKATLTVLDADTRWDVRIVDASKRGMGILLTTAIPSDSAVGVWYQGILILGVVRHCIQVEPGTFRCGLDLEQAYAPPTSGLSTSEVLSGLEQLLASPLHPLTVG